MVNTIVNSILRFGASKQESIPCHDDRQEALYKVAQTKYIQQKHCMQVTPQSSLRKKVGLINTINHLLIFFVFTRTRLEVQIKSVLSSSSFLANKYYELLVTFSNNRFLSVNFHE